MSRGTTNRAIRISDELWHAALAKADERDEVLAEMIRWWLELYVQDQHPKGTDPYTTAGASHIANCPQCRITFGGI